MKKTKTEKNDTERLDWLEAHHNLIRRGYGGWRRLFGKKDKTNWWPTLRDAIDAISTAHDRPDIP